MPTLPTRAIRKPADLPPNCNGQVPPRLLQAIEPSGRMHHLAAAGWRFLRAKGAEEGLTLVHVGDYRPLAQQEALFLARMKDYPDAKRQKQTTRRWQGKTWYLHTGAPVATPATSNHGYGLAIDAALRSRNGQAMTITARPAGARRSGLDFLLEWAPQAGFTWELQIEPWHITWCVGNTVPDLVRPFLQPVS